MNDAPLVAHSLAEAYLFLMATPCPLCGQGPLHGREPAAPSPLQGEGWGEGRGVRSTKTSVIDLTAECGACRVTTPWSFELAGAIPSAGADRPAVLNPTNEPSRILDVAQWVTLFRMISAKAAEQSDKRTGRRLLIEAGQCLDEALKFYELDNDLPPPTALFHEGSRQRLRTNPEQFSRQRLLGLRAKLPISDPLRP